MEYEGFYYYHGEFGWQIYESRLGEYLYKVCKTEEEAKEWIEKNKKY